MNACPECTSERLECAHCGAARGTVSDANAERDALWRTALVEGGLNKANIKAVLDMFAARRQKPEAARG